MAESEIRTPQRRAVPVGASGWLKSSYSNSKGNCVEFAVQPDGRIAIRDSTRTGDLLWAARSTVGAFVRAADQLNSTKTSRTNSGAMGSRPCMNGGRTR